MDSFDCLKCGATLDAADDTGIVKCKYCGAVHVRSNGGYEIQTSENFTILARRAFERGEFGKCLQLVEDGLKLSPNSQELLEFEQDARHELATLTAESDGNLDTLSEAEQYHLQATFILNELQANISVYGSNSAITGANPANVDLGLKYVNRSLELFPDSVAYMNTKALLLGESGVDKAGAIKILERAHELAPRDINVEENLKTYRSSACFVATAAFEGAEHDTVRGLRQWRDEVLTKSALGRVFVRTYYFLSPYLSRIISKSSLLKRATRFLLGKFLSVVR